MTNFNTNQVRQLYVVGAFTDGAVSNVGDLAFTGMNFVYKNANGNVVASDLIKNVTKVDWVEASRLGTPLLKHTVAVDTTAVDLSELEGETFTITIHLRQILGFAESDSLSVTASVVGNATNTASAAAFHKDLAMAIAKALPKRDYPYLRVFSNGSEVTATTPASGVTGAAAGVILVECPQKYVRGKLSNDPVHFDVEFHLHGSNTDDTPWGTDTVAQSDVTGYVAVPGYFKLADLEYFALGERADMYRGAYWPNDIEPTYMVDISGTTTYDVVSIEYYYAGDAENIQKSPKLIQIAVPHSYADDIYGVLETVYPNAQFTHEAQSL